MYAPLTKAPVDHMLMPTQEAHASVVTHYDASLQRRYSADAGVLTEEMRRLQASVQDGLDDTVGALGTLRELEDRMQRLEGNVLTASTCMVYCCY